MISLFSFLHTGTAFMVIVQFGGRLVQQYRACVVDSLGLGITCVLYHCTMCTRHPNLVSLAIPIFHIIICRIINLLVSSHFKTYLITILLIILATR